MLAFTLAETLIVMGIVGVIAALTLPNLNSSTGEKEKIAKLQKIYSNLNDALGRAEAVYGPYPTWFTNVDSDYKHSAETKRAAERMIEFMKVTKNCGTSDSSCGNFISERSYDFIVADGTAIGLYAISSTDTFIDVDLSGPNKGSNHDKFQFRINYQNGEIYPSGNNANCFRYKGSDCTAWVIQNGNIDYLKADQNGNCNNSNVNLGSYADVTTCK